MAYMDCEFDRRRKQFPPREDGKSCRSCKHFNAIIACNGWQSGPCEMKANEDYKSVFSIEYCDKHESA